MLRRDEEGVASTVATMFTFIIILMFMSAAFAVEEARQTEREWTLIREAEDSFGLLRAVHDVQFSWRLVPDMSPAFPTDGGVGVVVPLGMDPTSPFRTPVPGRLSCDPEPNIATVGFSFHAGRGTFDAVEGSDGVLTLDLGTPHIPGARVQWENGAILFVQGSDAVLVDYPYFTVAPVAGGVGLTYRSVRLRDDAWSVDGVGPQFLQLRTIAAETHTLDVAGGGAANLDEVQQFVRDLAREIYDASTDGSGLITGSYADSGIDVPDPPNNPNTGILNQGLKEQLDYYNSALGKQEGGDCGGAANEMNASARQLFDNTMNKILQGISEGYIDSDWGLNLHARMGTLHQCLDEMTGSLNDNCQFSCLSLFGDKGGRLEFLVASEHRAAWALWYNEYLSTAPLEREQWEVTEHPTFILVRIDTVMELTLEVAYVTFG